MYFAFFSRQSTYLQPSGFRSEFTFIIYDILKGERNPHFKVIILAEVVEGEIKASANVACMHKDLGVKVPF